MKRQKGITSLITALLINITTAACAQLAAGDRAPDFSASDVNGHIHSLAQYKGKYVVLEWFNYDCPFVKKQYSSGNMQKLQRDYAAKEVVWFSINSSAPGKQGNYPAEQMAQMAGERGVASTAVLLDPEGAVGKLYGAKTTPHLFIIDPKGTLIYQGAVDDRPSTDPADIAGAVNYVQKALDEAMSGSPVTTPETDSYGCSVKY
ncbi:MAG: thioredoxin family protein [Candidatus Omnitrophica bacterium]|nr:thioredoxin family protein [Candidatus Omnitrophota bacterium]